MGANGIKISKVNYTHLAPRSRVIGQNTLDNQFNDNVINDTNNGNVVDGVVDGVEDTVNGITNGVEDVVDGVDDSVHNMTEPNNVNTPSTGTNNTSR